MNKVKCVLVLTLSVILVFGASGLETTDNTSPFLGEWIGKIYLSSDHRSIDLRITITKQLVQQFFRNDSGWYAVTPKSGIISNILENNMVVGWVNTGGIWTETQLFSLSLVDKTSIEVQWIRHVNNLSEEPPNDVWSLSGQGLLALQKGGDSK